MKRVPLLAVAVIVVDDFGTTVVEGACAVDDGGVELIDGLDGA